MTGPEREFDLDGFIDSEVDGLRAKHDSSQKPKLQTELARVSREQNARERIARNEGPKLPIRDGKTIWTP